MLQTHPSELHNILIVFLTEKAGGLITSAGDCRCLQKNNMSGFLLPCTENKDQQDREDSLLPFAFWHI